MNTEGYLLLNWKKVVLIILVFIAAVVLHNMFYAVFGFEEAVFFIIAVFGVPLYVLVSGVYTFIHYLRKDRR